MQGVRSDELAGLSPAGDGAKALVMFTSAVLPKAFALLPVIGGLGGTAGGKDEKSLVVLVVAAARRRQVVC